MPDYTSSYNLSNRHQAGEIYFTDQQANYCTIVSTTKIYYNSVFNHWEFKVIDRDNNTYTWKDFRCLEGADKTNVKLAIFNHLVTDVVKVKEDGNNDSYLKTETSVADRGQDEYIGGF